MSFVGKTHKKVWSLMKLLSNQNPNWLMYLMQKENFRLMKTILYWQIANMENIKRIKKKQLVNCLPQNM